MIRRRAWAAIVAAALVAACSGGDDGDDTSDGSTPGSASVAPDEQTTTTASDATTTVADTATVDSGTVDAPDSTAGGTTTTLVPTTTTVPDGPTYPLTGLPMEDPDSPKGYRAALVVKIDNHPQARPQTGLNQADIVFEENVENLTRFAAVFQSGDSDPVGPIRSGRTQDIDLLGSLNRPLFAWSGGNPSVTRAIRSSDLVDISWTVAGTAGGYRRIRSPGVDTEHTLYADTTKLFTFTPVFAPPPPPQFTYREAGEAFNGDAVAAVAVEMDNVDVVWTWDADETRYERAQNGNSHMDSAGEQVNAANVVVLEVEYRPSPADRRSPEAQTIGFGPAHVLTAGVLVEGVWIRTDRLQPFTLNDLEGDVIALTPGRTWVELAEMGTPPVPL